MSPALSQIVRLRQDGRLDEAETRCRQALSSRPLDPAVYCTLATVLHRRGRVNEALDAMRRAVELAPRLAALRLNLGALLGSAGKFAEALIQLREAQRLGADGPELHNNLGIVLEKLGRATDAIAHYRTAIRQRPDYAEAHFNLADLLCKAGDMRVAERHYEAALRIRPAYAKAINGLAAVAGEMGDARRMIELLRKTVECEPNDAGHRSALLYALHYSPDYDAEALSREHREWGRRFCESLRRKVRPHENDRDPDRRLRIGYVSPDLREQTVTKFITPAIEQHDRSQFEIFCYSDVEKPDDTTRHVADRVEQWRNIHGRDDDEVEELIRSDRIDILVDLRGHAAGNRLPLFARRPAPVQVNMIGYFNTTGLSTMDYRITDAFMDPPGMTEHLHTEKLVRIEPSCWCYWPGLESPDVIDPPALRNGYITFGALNKLVKLSRPCAQLWARALETVHGSKLMISASLGEAARDRLAELGAAKERLIIVGKTATRREYLERYGQIDICLDTFPFNGITTTCDALWMGVPVVSSSRTTTVSRAGRSILTAANLPELAADSAEAFVRTTVHLASDLARLRELRLGMRQRLLASPLMDHRAYARELASAYRQMWRAWCAQAS